MDVKRGRCRDCVRVDAFFLRDSLVRRRDLDVTTGVTDEVTVEVTDGTAAAAPSDVVVGVEITSALASGGGGAEVSDGVGVAGGSGVGVTDCTAPVPSDVVVEGEISSALASGGGGGAEVSDAVTVAGGSGVGVTGGFAGGRGGSEENQSITVCAFQVGM